MNILNYHFCKYPHLAYGVVHKFETQIFSQIIPLIAIN